RPRARADRLTHARLRDPAELAQHLLRHRVGPVRDLRRVPLVPTGARRLGARGRAGGARRGIARDRDGRMTPMVLAPRPETFPQIRSSLRFYQITAYITGIMLLLLCLEMLLKYAFGLEIELGGAFGFLALVPADTVEAVNLSI